MSYLAKAVNRKLAKGIRTVIYGSEGSGKTTLATSAASSILLPTEDGWVGLDKESDIVVLPTIATYEDILGIIRELAVLLQSDPANFPFKNIIIDSATALERLIHDYTLRSDPKYATGVKLTMESAHGGYGASYSFANDIFTKLLGSFDWFVAKGINVTITCHAMAITEKDTIAGDEYTTMDCALHSPKNGKSTGKREIIKQWCDILGYLHTPIYVTGKEGGFKTAMSASSDKVLGLHGNPKYAAKNRFSVQEPLIIPKDNGWLALMGAVNGSPSTATYIAPQEPVTVETVATVAPADTLFSEVPVAENTDDLFAENTAF
jgi:energy-coupling factor transporter ATP-binding protein EcfA2